MKIVNFKTAAAASMLAMILTGCGGGGGGRSGPSAGIANNPAAPVQIGRTGGAQTAAGTSVLGPLDETLVRKAIENYRLSKKRAKSAYRIAGADLNGDGIYEAIVLFEGKDWCTKTGCSMAIFQNFSHGFRPISRTVRVKAPVEVADSVTNTYRDILVQTGGGPAPERRVRLQFSGSDYSRNAMLQPEVPLGTAERTEIAIAEVQTEAPSTARR
ncbi:MAG: hypothetical protein ACTSP0_06965 [Alphaproteobacteria bacterium]